VWRLLTYSETASVGGLFRSNCCHRHAVALYIAHYNLCRIHEALRATPAMGLGIAVRVWTIGDLLDAALATQPIDPIVTAPDRRKRFPVIEGGGSDSVKRNRL